jgi:type I restriction enzyme M protein
LKQKQITSEDLAEFVHCYSTSDRSRRRESRNFRRVKYADIIARDKASLDIQWLREDASKPDQETPQTLIAEILQDLDEAMKEFAAAEAEIHRK